MKCSYWRFIDSIATLTLLALSAVWVSATPDDLPLPIVPENERPLLGFDRERMPSQGWIDFGASGLTFTTATSESVGDGSSLLVYAEKRRPGRVIAHNSKIVVDPQNKINEFLEYAGICFWYHGDGTDATGVLAWGDDLKHKHRFSLRNTGWKKEFIPWYKFGDYFDTEVTHTNLALSIEMPDPSRYNYTLDKVRTYSGEKPFEERHSPQIVSKWGARLIRPGGGFVIESDDLNVEEKSGIQFWMIGSGTSAKGTIAWWGNTDAKKFFSLEDTEWKHFAFDWNELPPQPDHIPPERQRLIISLQPPTRDGHYMVIDRLHLYKHAVVEPVKPTVRNDPPGFLSTKPFLKRREKLEAFGQRLKNNDPINVLAIGDSIISGANLAYLHNGENRFYMSGFGGWMLTATASRHGYKFRFLNVEIYNPRNGRWNQITPASAHRKGFYATVLGTEGTNSELTPLSLDRVDSYKPDLVLVQPGVYDVIYTSPEVFEQKLDSFVKDLIGKNYLVVLGSQTPVIDTRPHPLAEEETYFERSRAFAPICEKIADKYDIPFVDVRRALEHRGSRYIGDNFQDHILPNKRGHRIIGLLYYAMISGEDRDIWQFVPSKQDLEDPYSPRIN